MRSSVACGRASPRCSTCPTGTRSSSATAARPLFWDVATLCLIEDRAAFGTFGEFGAKFAAAATRAPFVGEPVVTSAAPGGVAVPGFADGVDTYAWPHNETSTGVVAPVRRVAGSREQGALVLVDGTSGAGGLAVDVAQTDVYYFAPQKSFASDGGLWLAAASPAAIERAARIESSGRWVPESLSFTTAVTNSRLDQTLNTPAIATLVLLAEQLDWILGNGGLAWAAQRTATSAGHLYGWAESRDWATPFVADPALRSDVVGTIDLDPEIEAATVAARAARPRRRRRRALPQAGPQPAAGRHVPGGRAGRRARAHRLRRPRGGPARLTPARQTPAPRGQRGGRASVVGADAQEVGRRRRAIATSATARAPMTTSPAPRAASGPASEPVAESTADVGLSTSTTGVGPPRPGGFVLQLGLDGG